MDLSLKCRSVANYIIEQINKFNEGKTLREKIFLTTKRLQKIIYFCEVEYMKRNNGKPLFDDEYYAWPSGPVIPDIYSKFMMYQDGELNPRHESGEKKLSKDVKSIIDEILVATKEVDTKDLINISSVPGSPYDKVFDENDVNYKQLIPKKDIYCYYAEKKLMLLFKNNGNYLGSLYQDEIIRLKDKTLQLRYMLGGLYLHGGMVDGDKFWDCDNKYSVHPVSNNEIFKKVKNFIDKHHISNESFIMLTRSYLSGTINPYKGELGNLISELDRIIVGYNFGYTNYEIYHDNDLKERELMNLILKEAYVNGSSLNVFLRKYSLTTIDFMILAKTSINYKFKNVKGFEKNDLFRDLEEILSSNNLYETYEFVKKYRNNFNKSKSQCNKIKLLTREIRNKFKK